MKLAARFANFKPRVWQIDAAGVVACALLTAAAYLIGILPILRQRDEATVLEGQVTEQRQKAASAASMARTLRGQLASAQNTLAQLTVPLQPATSANSRIASITTLAAERGLDVQYIRAGALQPGSRFSQLPIQLSALGSYRTSAALIHEMRQKFPDMAVASFELSGDPVDPEAPASFVVQLTWYVQPTLTAKTASARSE